MELTDDNLITLGNYLLSTLNPEPNVRRAAEKFLSSVELNQNYAILLLHLIDKVDVDLTVRVAAAISFKNFIKRNWPVDEDGVDRIHQSDRDTIKSLIVSLMLKSPESIQKQFSDAVSIIGKYDFPDKWPSLIVEMVNKFGTGDFHVINGILRTAHSLFKRYRFEFKSDKLWLEIKLVLDSFAKPLTELFVATIELTVKHEGNPEALRVIYGSLGLICKVFHSLNYQDLPEFFEDNMPVWMPNLLTLLNVKVPSLDTQDDNEPGVLERLRAEVCECVALYALKYDEEFRPYAAGFVTAVWGLLVTTGLQAKYDMLVSNALGFLSRVADKPHYKALFQDPSVLTNICQKVIIPNMEFRESDLEMFEDNPEEYVRRDMEGSDVDTRRRSACDLVRSLSQHYEEQIFAIFGQYIQSMLETYRASGSSWHGADAALYLVTSLAARAATERAGVTRASPLVDLAQFAQQNIYPELQAQNVNTLHVIKADSIKYVMTFRSLLPREQIVAIFPLLIRHLSSSSGVVQTYASACIERVLGARLVTREELVPNAAAMLEGLIAVTAGAGQELNQNEYVMKAVMRALSTLQEDSLPFLGAILPKLAQMLATVAKNPSKPHFNHYLFESLSLAVKIVCSSNPAAVGSFEDALFPIFQEILQQDVQEFLPYVFQLMSVLVEARGTGPLEGPYAGLLPCLLAPPPWERPANVRPLVRLLCAYLVIDAQHILREGKLNGMLGVFQKLIASKANDHEGFYLIQCLLHRLPRDATDPFIKQIITLLFQRLSSSKTTKYVKGLIAFFGFYVAFFGADNLVQSIDSLQANMFGLYVERVLVADLQKISGTLETKMAAIGCTKLLCESSALNGGPYSHLWPQILQVLLSLFELPQDDTLLPDDHYVEVEDVPGYQAAYSQLNFAQSKQPDPFPEITDLRHHLVQSLAKLSSSRPGAVLPLVQKMPQEHQNMLQTYCNKYQMKLY